MLRKASDDLLLRGIGFACFTRQRLKFSSGENKLFILKSLSYNCNQNKIFNQVRLFTYNNVYRNIDSRNSIENVKNQLLKSNQPWYESLKLKQQTMAINSTFEDLCQQNNQILNQIEVNSNIQQFLLFLTTKADSTSLVSNSENKNPLSMKSIKDSQSIESAFILILHTILRVINPEYNNDTVDLCLQENISKYNLKASELFISKEVLNDSVFGDLIHKIIRDSRFQLATQILKIRLDENKGWKAKHECRDDNVLTWINSLFESSNTKCLIQLTKSKFIPDIIIYDLLLRKPQNELEYKYFLEFYKSSSMELNLIDQEKLFYLKQFDNKFNRNLIIPPLFNNFFQIAIRSNLENLPILIDLFLNENNISSSNTLEQISEMIWYLSFDNSGAHMNKPSRYCNISQSKLIKAVNRMIESNKSLEVDVTTMLGVSNLSYYRDFCKSFQMFKNAKKQFDHWQLEQFKPKDFKKIGISRQNENNLKKLNSELLHNIKVDYNIKFLCNSVLLLAVNEKNRNVISQDLCNIFKKIEPEILVKYPEIWQFVVIKLNYHKMMNEQMIGMLIQEYLKCHQTLGINNYFVLDSIINNTEKPKTLISLIENLEIKNFDDNNISHIISKLYKFAKNSDETDLETYDCLNIARNLYNKASFKSTRLNSSHLLGESIFSPEETYERYNSINQHFKTTQLSISSLFVSVYKLFESGKYDSIKWDNKEPIEFALNEFNKHISKSYGDTSDGLLYPNDNLLTIYIKVLKILNKNEEIKVLLNRLVDLRYPVGITLFNIYLDSLNDWDKRELIRCLNAYDLRFNNLISCENEFALKKMKEKLPKIEAKGTFQDFISKLEFNWAIVRHWNWPGRNKL
jgi:hypothetical protein